MSDGATQYYEYKRKINLIKENIEHKFWLDIAHKFAEKSTCARVKVGGVLVKKGRAVCSAWNGVSSKQEHCCDYYNRLYDSNEELKQNNKTYDDFLKSETFFNHHREFSRLNELHVEMNIVNYSSREDREGSILYLTISPCINCAKLIQGSGIKEVYFRKEYDREIEGIDFLNKRGVVCKKIEE